MYILNNLSYFLKQSLIRLKCLLSVTLMKCIEIIFRTLRFWVRLKIAKNSHFQVLRSLLLFNMLLITTHKLTHVMIISLIWNSLTEFVDLCLILFIYRGAVGFSKMLITLKLWEMSNESVPSLFRKQAATRKNKNAFLIDDKAITFQEVLTREYVVVYYILWLCLTMSAFGPFEGPKLQGELVKLMMFLITDNGIAMWKLYMN